MSESRILLVQCCHLPQFFYVAKKLRQRHPKWQLDALFCAPSQVDFYLEKFPYFQRVHFLENNGQSLPDGSDGEAIVFPLLNRGYWKIKKTARGLPLENLEVDYTRASFTRFWRGVSTYHGSGCFILRKRLSLLMPATFRCRHWASEFSWWKAAGARFSERYKERWMSSSRRMYRSAAFGRIR